MRPAERISTRNLTSRANWGGPQHREMLQAFPQAKQMMQDNEIFKIRFQSCFFCKKKTIRYAYGSEKVLPLSQKMHL
ncbi:hypothetical protein, partial [Staphylococcus lugdunensis]